MDDKQQKSSGCWPFLVAAIPLSLSIMYVLSSGPTLMLVAAGHLESDIWHDFYGPLISVSLMSAPTWSALHWYLGIWGGG